MKTIGYAAQEAGGKLERFDFERRELRPNDVAIDIEYCGVCHSDLHQVANDWGRSMFPMVPGHEIVGRVVGVGSNVKNFKEGDRAAVGCLVDSCMECDQCEKHNESYCRNGFTGTYNGEDRETGDLTFGGYSKHIVTREEFVLKVSDKLDMTRAAPILCAGITMYSPLKEWKIGKGSRVGIIGLGGLGHMGIKLAAAMGAKVTAISRNNDKEQEAKEMGAEGILASTDADAMASAANSFDLIINTVPVKHDLTSYLPLLDIDGTLVIVGQMGPVEEVMTQAMIFGRRRIAGSLIGGLKDTQEVLDFCAEHNIHPDCEMIKMEDINDAFDRLKKGEIAHRFVIDMKSFG